VISPLIYGPMVLFLLTAHGLTFWIYERRVRELQDALTMRETLLDDDGPSTAHIAPGGSMVITMDQCYKRVRIWSKTFAQLRITFE
jgi:hypothetical protein